MMNKPIFSIITVVYNAASELEKTIQSIIDQSYENVEYIIIDGGSTDKTIDVIKKHEDKITIWISEPDKGIYDAMNKGIKYASGKWINFMNAGDIFYDKNILQYLADSITVINDFDVVYGKTLCKFSWGNYIVTPSNLDNITKSMPFCHQSTFVKSKLLKEKPFDLKYRICADHFWFLDLYKNKPYTFYYVPITISIFDAITGISSTNNICLYNELGEFSDVISYSKTSLYKKNILKYLPYSITNYLYRILYHFNDRFHKV